MLISESKTTQSELDFTIQFVKNELQNILTKKKELIKKLGEAFKKVVSKEESICEEIKNTLQKEIANGIISSRTIEQYCLPEWKKKTRPKNEKTSFSELSPPAMVVSTAGQIVPELISHSAKNNTSIIDEIAADTNDRILRFQISIPYDQLRRFMAAEFKLHYGTETVLIYGNVSTITGKVLSYSLGKEVDKVIV